MIFQQRPATIEATQITTASIAAQLLGGDVVDAPGGCWAVEVERDGVRLHWSGQLGDYLASGPWQVIDRATFEALWVPMDVILAARSAQSSSTTILGLRKGSVEVTDSALIGGVL